MSGRASMRAAEGAVRFSDTIFELDRIIGSDGVFTEIMLSGSDGVFTE